MNPEESLDLRALAEVESPAVVQSALRRFRRKIFTTGALVMLAVVCLAGGILWATVMHRTLDERIAEAPGKDVAAVFSAEGRTVVLRRVARLEEGVGLHFLLVHPDAGGAQNYSLRTEGIRDGMILGGSKTNDSFLVIAPSDDGTIPMRLFYRDGCDPPPGGGLCRSEAELVSSFEIDLNELGVPGSIWGTGG